jgi:DNA mismatch endonuclease (patch repair protein)
MDGRRGRHAQRQLTLNGRLIWFLRMDVFDAAKRSLVMSRIRSHGNRTTELRFILLLRKLNITGWRRSAKLPGKPDFIFKEGRLAVFIDGDFWHGNPRNFRMPTSNQEYWEKKIERNRRRDKSVNKLLRSKGWKVIRIWESHLKQSEQRVIRRLRMLFR